MRKGILGLSISLIGFGATVYLTARAAPKIKEQFEKKKPETIKEKTKIIFQEAKPAIAVGAITVGSMIFVDNKRNKEIKKWYTFYTLSEQMSRQYRKELVKNLGFSAEEDITKKALENTLENGSKINSYYEPYSGCTFEMSENDLLKWEYEFNKFYTENGMATLSDFLNLRNYESNARTDSYGWSALDEVFWIDISHNEKLDDGRLLLDFETGPSTTYMYNVLKQMGYDYDPELERPTV